MITMADNNGDVLNRCDKERSFTIQAMDFVWSSMTFLLCRYGTFDKSYRPGLPNRYRLGKRINLLLGCGNFTTA